MGSSGITRNPIVESRVPLLLVIAGEDHPRACTGRKLLRAGFVRELGTRHRPLRSPLLLDPHATRPLIPSDRPIALASGLLGVDCSWNRLDDRGGYPRGLGWVDGVRPRRRLPWLRAANPQHYGKLAELNTAEAFGASLVILGERGRARALLDRFPGGAAFLELNRDALDRYASSRDEGETRRAESEVVLGVLSPPSKAA